MQVNNKIQSLQNQIQLLEVQNKYQSQIHAQALQAQNSAEAIIGGFITAPLRLFGIGR